MVEGVKSRIPVIIIENGLKKLCVIHVTCRYRKGLVIMYTVVSRKMKTYGKMEKPNRRLSGAAARTGKEKY